MAEFEEYKLMNASIMNKNSNVLGRMFVSIELPIYEGTKIQAKTTDKKVITIEMKNPISQPINPGWIEVLGISKSSYFYCNEIICFNENEKSEPLDEEAHNEICNVLNLLSQDVLYKSA